MPSDLPPLLTLPALLRDGGWGDLQPGITRQQLVERLGPPGDWMVSDTEHRARQRGAPVPGWTVSAILRYGGSMEFHFPEDDRAGRCWMVFCDDLDSLTAPFSSAWLHEGMTLAAACARLDREGLAWRQAPFRPDPQQLRLIVGSGVRIGLSADGSFFDGPDSGAHRVFCVERMA